MDRVIEQLPRFLSPLNLWFLGQAMGMTLALTFFGCGLGFLLAFIVVYMRLSPGWWGLPWRILAILLRCSVASEDCRVRPPKPWRRREAGTQRRSG